MFLAKWYVANGMHLFEKAIKDLTKGIDIMEGQREQNNNRIKKLQNENGELDAQLTHVTNVKRKIEDIIK